MPPKRHRELLSREGATPFRHGNHRLAMTICAQLPDPFSLWASDAQLYQNGTVGKYFSKGDFGDLPSVDG
jgi:predicted transcriptional regulator